MKPLGVSIAAANARVEITPQRLTLSRLAARAEDGTLTGRGAVALSGYTATAINATLSFDRWPAIATHEYQATIDGKLSCSGSGGAPNIVGNFEVLKGEIHPVMNLTAGPPPPDTTIVVANSWSEAGHPLGEAQTNGKPRGSPMFQQVGVNIATQIHRNTWIRTGDSAVEIEGEVDTVKPNRGDIYLSGAIRTVRGTLVVADKIFTVTHGEIQFTGGTPTNPALDVAAQYNVPNYQVTALVTGTADKPVLTLSSVPSLPQSDILALLMFGKPADQLNAGEQQGLQQQAATMAAGAATAEVGKAVAQAMGLQDLGVTATSGGVGVGHYLGSRVYVSGSQATTTGQGQQGSVSLYLTPHLKLDTSASTNSQVGNQIELKWHKEY